LNLPLCRSQQKGYKPAFNYQRQLHQVVLSHIAANLQELDVFSNAADTPVEAQPHILNWANVLDPDLPERISSVKEIQRDYLARKPNYTERERNNRSLGERGEQFVLDFERFRLEQAGRPDLAQDVKWVSKEKGDGAGFDIQSFTVESEEELFIEVKTTNCGKYQPFYITDNELAYSLQWNQQYCLYRVYDFKNEARLFRLQGAVEQYVHLQAKNYKASFN